MTPNKRTLHIYYRHVHVKSDLTSRDPNKQRPHWFSHETCFRNLLTTVRESRLSDQVSITIVYDGSTDDFMDDFSSKYFSNQEYGIKLQFIKGGSDLNSFRLTLYIGRTAEIKNDDLIYILENDYLHQHGWVDKVFELYDAAYHFDYISLYDHRDKYIYEMYRDLTAKIISTTSHHWRTTPSTCASFILAKEILDRDYEILSSGLTDYYFFSKLINENGRILLTPVPGLATHSMEGYLSPTIDWSEVAREASVV